MKSRPSHPSGRTPFDAARSAPIIIVMKSLAAFYPERQTMLVSMALAALVVVRIEDGGKYGESSRSASVFLCSATGGD